MLLRSDITIYSRQFFLLQTVALVDRDEITRHPNTLNIPRSLGTDDILKFLDALQTKDRTELHGQLEEIIMQFLSRSNNNFECQRLSAKMRQPIAIQIWNIDGLNLKPEDEVSGSLLVLHYAWELSALLSFYTEHFRRKGLWKNRRLDQVQREFKSETDVLKDHRIVTNERVCIEISQVNHPYLTPVSAQRLYAYGYDSTSIFLWGYLALQDAALEYYSKQADTSLYEIESELSTWIIETDKAIDKEVVRIKESKKIPIMLRELVARRLEIISAVGRHTTTWMYCYEDRHIMFLNQGTKLRKIDEKKEEIYRSLNNVKELAFDFTQVLLAVESGRTNIETNNLLKEAKQLNENQSNMTKRLNILNFLVGGTAIAPLTEFITSLIQPLNNTTGKIIVVISLAIIFFSLILTIMKFKSDK